MKRDKFTSKKGFVLASIGAAVGLGNALRFPGLCARYGGGAYMLVYLIALVALGIPLLNAEIALGRKYKGGAPACMERLKSGGGRLGWSAGVNSVFTAIIYAGLAGWIITMVFQIVPLSLNAHSVSEQDAANYFFSEIINARPDFSISSISFFVLVAIFTAWVLIFVCLKGGAKGISKAAQFTVIIPVILFSAMAIRGLFYSNSGVALAKLFTPDFSCLLNPIMWLSALGQVFFSLSVAVGIMPAYGSYLPEGTNIFSCSLLIAAADFFVSILSSVVLFTTLYGCGLEAFIGESGIITAFKVYPVAITKLFGANTSLNAVVGVLFYLSLAMMAVQAAVSMLEAFLNPFLEYTGKSRTKLSLSVCGLGAIFGLFFATDGAVTAVNLSDKFVNFYNVLILAIAECLLIGTSGQAKSLAGEINRFTKRLKMPLMPFEISVIFLSPVILISLTLCEIVNIVLFGLGAPLWAQIAFGWSLSAVVILSGFAVNFNFGKRSYKPT